MSDEELERKMKQAFELEAEIIMELWRRQAMRPENSRPESLPTFLRRELLRNPS